MENSVMVEKNAADARFKPVSVHIDIDEKLYVKDPNSSALGQRIISQSIDMINEMGFESFTFRKLATAIDATEPTIYRYFENKHKVLHYLLAWYWNWMDYKLILLTANILSPIDRLRVAIKLLSAPIEKDPTFGHVDESALYKVVVVESSKVYLIKDVDAVNREGLFIGYKRLCNRVAAIIHEINPGYRYPKALISTVIESSHDQKYFAEHLPNLTDIPRTSLHQATEFLTEMVFNTIGVKD